MAKSRRKSVSASSQSALVFLPLRARVAAQVFIPFDVEKEAHAIVAQILAHFGAGYGAQRQQEVGGVPSNVTIFETPTVLASFQLLLHKSTVDHFPDVRWDIQPNRDTVLVAAFEHGVLCRQRVVADGSGTLNLIQILDTIKVVQSTICSPGGGGGAPCSF
jgi:hypothetical protein